MKHTRIRSAFSILMAAICIQMSAQEIVLTATSEVYPNERPQWSEAKCEAWQQKYGPIRGINCPFPPCGAMSQEQAMAKAASLGYNSVRWWPAGGTNASDYIKAVEQWAEWADRHGMTVSPVFGFVYSYFNQANHEVALKNLEAQVRTIIRHFRGDDRIILWDVWNEPNMNDDKTPEMMEWIAKIVKWCQQEGCTQPISASIVWDGGVWLNNQESSGNRLLRDNVERLMDVHNYHDYGCQDSFNGETASMVNRLNKLGKRPLVCTECMTRTNGSTYARTLVDFAKYNINFYAWGLYACDPNWEVRWDRSTFYNWEPMFHNALYADGEPYNETEPQWVKNFTFQGDFGGVKTDAEYTERWAERRAWKWMINGERKGMLCSSLTEATAAVAAHSSDGIYNTVCVNIPYQAGATALSTEQAGLFNSLLRAADAAGMTVLPVLFTSEHLTSTASSMATYAYNVINSYYTDRRIQGWCIYRQTRQDSEATLKAKLPEVFRRARYAFSNQPLFAAPLLTEGTMPDSTREDAANLMWQLSDVCGLSAASATEAFLGELAGQYRRPVLRLGEQELLQAPVADHLTPGAPASRWPAWMAWRWMDRKPVRGISCSSITAALTKMNALRGTSTPYNSISVVMDYRTFVANKESFYEKMDSLLKMAGETGMTVLPQMLSDTYAKMTTSALQTYITEVLGRYAQDKRILAWDIYNKVCATSTDKSKGTQLVEALFAAARTTGAQQPIYMTPSVSTSNFAADFDYVSALVHGKYDGWNRLTYGGGDVNLCYKIWCMSDVICYASNQSSPLLGWLNAMACKFGRPLFCAEWKVAASESPSRVLDVFRDMHVSWYVSGALDDASVAAFHYIPVSTGH